MRRSTGSIRKPVVSPSHDLAGSNKGLHSIMESMSSPKTLLLTPLRKLIILMGFDRLLTRWTLDRPVRSLPARLVPGHMLYRKPTLRRVRHHGIDFELDVSDYMEWCAYYGLAIEPRAVLYGLVRPGDVALDVGTNIGETLLNFARITGDKGVVYGFEPNPVTFRKCQANIALNPQLGPIRLFNEGLGDREAVLHMHTPSPRNTGGDRIALSHAKTDGLVVVKVVTLDQVVERERITSLNFIKIDVEGFELNVLRGAERSLRRFQPVLFIELDDTNLREQDATAAALVKFLANLGYQAFRATGGQALSSTDDYSEQHFDIVCRPVGS